MTRITLLIVLNVCTILSYSQSQKGMEIRSWSIRIGDELPFMSEGVESMRDHFGPVTYLNNNFTGYRFDSTVSHLGVYPYQFEIDVAIGHKEVTQRWKSHLEFRFLLGILDRETGYDNRVHDVFYPTTNGQGIIHREQYEFSWAGTHVYGGSEMIWKGNYRGKRQRRRWWYGLRLVPGIGNTRLYAYHLTGDYDGTTSGSTLTYRFPPIWYTESSTASQSYTTFSMAYGAVGGIEWGLGLKRRFHLGAQFHVGGYIMTMPEGKPVSSGIMGFQFQARFSLGKKESYTLVPVDSIGYARYTPDSLLMADVFSDTAIIRIHDWNKMKRSWLFPRYRGITYSYQGSMRSFYNGARSYADDLRECASCLKTFDHRQYLKLNRQSGWIMGGGLALMMTGIMGIVTILDHGNEGILVGGMLVSGAGLGMTIVGWNRLIRKTPQQRKLIYDSAREFNDWKRNKN